MNDTDSSVGRGLPCIPLACLAYEICTHSNTLRNPLPQIEYQDHVEDCTHQNDTLQLWYTSFVRGRPPVSKDRMSLCFFEFGFISRSLNRVTLGIFDTDRA
jgi:hypothetical protein